MLSLFKRKTEAPARGPVSRKTRGGCSRSSVLKVRVERMYESFESEHIEESISVLPDASCHLAAPDTAVPIYRHVDLLAELNEALDNSQPERIAAAVNRMTPEERRDYVYWENSIYSSTVRLYLDYGCQLVLFDETQDIGIGVSGTGSLYCVVKNDQGKFRLHPGICLATELVTRLQNLTYLRTAKGLIGTEVPAYII